MKIKIKNLKGEMFEVEAEPSQTIAELKQQLEADKGLPAESMKLIFKGKTLGNDQQLEKLVIRQNDSFVIMNQVQKPKTIIKPADQKETKEKKQEIKSESLKEKTEEMKEKKESNEVNEHKVEELSKMGFPKEQCLAALKAAFGNIDRAVEYLLNGIPQGTNLSQNVNHPAEKLIAELNKLPQIEAQLETFKTRLQNNPGSLHQILASIEKSAPELYQAILQHPEEFEDMIMGEDEEMEELEGEGEEEGGIQLTEEEQAALGRLVGLGVSRVQAIQAYLACDKNEELAANLLLDRLARGQIDPFDDEQGHSEEDDENNIP